MTEVDLIMWVKAQGARPYLYAFALFAYHPKKSIGKDP
jgi:hypothetical protein